MTQPVIYDTLHPEIDIPEVGSTRSATRFTESQLAKLTEALIIANDSIKDPLFEKILTDQSNAGVYSWGYGRLSRIEERHRNDPTAFFLSEFRARGLPAINQFIPRDDYKNDDVTGSTFPCKDINFNVDNLDRASRTPVYVAGTIVHERVHSFCYQHRSNNINKDYNLCDFAYHAGHMTIIINLYRTNDSNPIKKPLIKICGSLVKRLQDEKIIKK